MSGSLPKGKPSWEVVGETADYKDFTDHLDGGIRDRYERELSF
jgi:hypothetical protein